MIQTNNMRAQRMWSSGQSWQLESLTEDQFLNLFAHSSSFCDPRVIFILIYSVSKNRTATIKLYINLTSPIHNFH